MKILAVADIHGDLGLVKRIEKMVEKENVDLVILAGDQTWFEQDKKGLVGPLTKRPALIIPSNHETEWTVRSWEDLYPNLRSIHVKNMRFGDVGFFGSGTVDWGFEENSRKVFEELKSAHEGIRNMKKKVMITHCPPEGSAIELMGFPGSYGIRKAIEKFSPDFLVCGHIHEGGGLDERIAGTRVLNVARTPTIFEI